MFVKKHSGFYFILLLLIFFSCSTEKSTYISRSYHYVTARFNAFFNGNESLQNSINSFESSYNYDYEEILPLFLFPNESEAKNFYANADVAIKKSTKVIKRHSILKNGKEHNEMIDDTYMLVGKANFYKHEFEKAAQNFEYIAKQFDDNPSRFDAMLWLALTYMQKHNYEDAQTLLDLVEEEEELKKKTTALLASTYAYYFIKQNEYMQAVPNLKDAIENTRKKDIKSRYTYILAQIYEFTGNTPLASQTYSEVVRLNPDYEMAFNAKIKHALLFDTGTGNSDQIKNELNKMLKDKKNTEYYDQIYYTLAQLEKKENHIDVALDYLLKCLAANTDNKKQKALAYTDLGDIYFDRKSYENAYSYYDSTLSIIEESFERYYTISARKNSLTELVQYLKVIEHEDSVLGIARMGESEREKYIEQLVDAEMLKREQAKENKQNMQTEAFNTLQNIGIKGDWYFYNETLKKFGYNEFKKIWGERLLEDNWRRSVKLSGLALNESEELLPTISKESEKEKLYAEYMQGLPLSEDKLLASEEKLIEAYYNVGEIYIDQFDDYPEAIKSFETLLQKFPNTVYTLPIYYRLYRIYTNSGDIANSRKYEDLILKEYPESDYAKIIKDPSYYQQLLDEKNKPFKIYDETYTAYKNGKYQQVIANCDIALKQFNDTTLLPKFAFLKALSVGKTDSIKAFKLSLSEVKLNYHRNKVADEATYILNYLANYNPDEALPMFDFDSDFNYPHFYILVVNNNYVNIQKLKENFSNYHAEFYSTKNYGVSSNFLNPETQMLIVKKFENKEAALTYYKNIKEEENIFSIIQPNKFEQFIISSKNFPFFYQQKESLSYLNFFVKNYLTP